jgi:hypothetical protein
MTRNFSKVTAAVLATLTISAAAASFTTETASAGWRGERMGRMGHVGHMGRHGYGHRHGGHRGFGRGFGAGMAAGIIGVAIIAAANEHRETVARIRYDQAARKAQKPPVVVAKPTRECELVKEWEKLLQSAEATLAADKRMNAQYGEDVRDDSGNVVRTNHSSDHTRFQEQEVERIREELRKAKEACNRQAAR